MEKKEGSVSLTFKRYDKNIFVDGFPGSHGTVQILPVWRPRDFPADVGGNSYIDVELYGRYGIAVVLFRMSDGKVLDAWKTLKSEDVFVYDPWKHLIATDYKELFPLPKPQVGVSTLKQG